MMSSFEDWKSFSKVLRNELAQALEYHSALSFAIGRLCGGHNREAAAVMGAVLERVRSCVHCGDLVGEVDGRTIAVLLPRCDASDAASLAGRLARYCRHENRLFEIEWQSGEVVRPHSVPAMNLADIVSLEVFKLLGPGDADP